MNHEIVKAWSEMNLACLDYTEAIKVPGVQKWFRKVSNILFAKPQANMSLWVLDKLSATEFNKNQPKSRFSVFDGTM